MTDVGDTITSTTSFKTPSVLSTTRTRQLSAPGGIMSSSTRLPATNIFNSSFGIDALGGRITFRQGSECTDRPDSGFDSKDDEEVRSSSSGGASALVSSSFSYSSHNMTQEIGGVEPSSARATLLNAHQHHQQVSETISEEATTSGNPGDDPILEGENNIAGCEESSSSPDVTTEISRQAPIRQPVIRKRRLNAP